MNKTITPNNMKLDFHPILTYPFRRLINVCDKSCSGLNFTKSLVWYEFAYYVTFYLILNKIYLN